MSKVQEKQKAIRLRKSGYTYNEISKKLLIAKSSLSLWLKDLPLTEKEKSYLKSRRDSNITKGRIRAASANRENRLERERVYVEDAKRVFNENERHSLFLVGVALYWAEGSKRDDSCSFMNSDPQMLRVFIKWLGLFKIKTTDLDCSLHIHKHYAHEHCENFWSEYLLVPVETIKIYFKRDNKGVKKRPDYKGCLRVRVKRGSQLLFKLKVWQNMLARKYSN